MSINKIFSFLPLLISFVLGFNLGRDIWRLKKAEKRIFEAEQRLGEVKKENDDLEKQKEYYQSEQFLEEQIRDKLQMAKEGEKIVILPQEIIEGGMEQDGETGEEEKENWGKWLELFQ